MDEQMEEERLREQFPFMYERKLRASQQKISKQVIPAEFFRKQETSIKVFENADSSGTSRKATPNNSKALEGIEEE